MEWQQIIGFYQLVKQGSFTRAAHASFRTQSALSQQIRKLEDEFGCALVLRTQKKKFELTPEGERFFLFAKSVLGESEQMSSDLSALKGMPRQKLSIAAPFTTLFHLFPAQFRKYADSHPHVELTILDRPQSVALELLKAGDVDIAVASESAVPKGFELRRWRELEPVLIVPEKHPLLHAKRIRLSDIVQYPLILPPGKRDGKGRPQIQELLEKEGRSCRVVMESGNVELSARYVEAGIGIAFATVAKGLDPLKGRRLRFIPMRSFFPPDYISIVCPANKTRPDHASDFIEQIMAS